MNAYRVPIRAYHVSVSLYCVAVDAYHVAVSAYRVMVDAYRVAVNIHLDAVKGDCNAASAAHTACTPTFWAILPKSAKIAGSRKKAVAFQVLEWLCLGRVCAHPTADAHAKRVHAIKGG